MKDIKSVLKNNKEDEYYDEEEDYSPQRNTVVQITTEKLSPTKKSPLQKIVNKT